MFKPNLQEAMEKAVVSCYVDVMSRKQLERRAYMQHLAEQKEEAKADDEL